MPTSVKKGYKPKDGRILCVQKRRIKFCAFHFLRTLASKPKTEIYLSDMRGGGGGYRVVAAANDLG